MPSFIAQSPDNPHFPRIIAMHRLRDQDGFDFDLAPDEAETKALSRLFEARSVRKMRFSGRLQPAGEGIWTLYAQFGATVVQSCVVTLEPVTTRIDMEVRRRFVPSDPRAAHEIIVSPHDEDDDEIEPLGDRLDLGLVAVEALALALPAYPRCEGVSLETATRNSPGVSLGEAEVKPFAGLAALRDKLGGNT